MSSLEKSSGQAKGRGRTLTPSRNRAREQDGADLTSRRPQHRDDPSARFSKRYTMALQNYLLHPQEVFLQLAYELGRQAVAEGIGLLNILRIHTAAVGVHASSGPDSQRA